MGGELLFPALSRMRAITVLQPSSAAMAATIGPHRKPVKPWENRDKPMPKAVRKGDWIALHAGVAPWKHAAKIRGLWPACPSDDQLTFGAVIGAWRYDGEYTAELARTFWPEDAQWAFGPMCYRVGASVTLPEPIVVGGCHQGWWFIPEEVSAALRTVIAAFESNNSQPG